MRVWKRVSLFLSVLVVLAALYMTPLFGNKPAVIVSGSMEPTIQTGAFILVHFSDFEDCEVGDVITYYHPGFDELATHRIVEKGEDYYWTKGDANTARDNISVIEDRTPKMFLSNLSLAYLNPMKARFAFVALFCIALHHDALA